MNGKNDFLEEFREICSNLGGTLTEDEMGFPICLLKNGAELVGFPDYDTIAITKNGETILEASDFDRTVLSSKYISPTRFAIKGFGKRFACFKTKCAGICINEKGDVVRVLIPEKEEWL